MSDYEHIKGRIKRIPQDIDETMEQYFERVTGCTDYNKNYYDNLTDLIWDNNLDEKFIVLNRELYQFLDYKNITDYFDFCDITPITEDEFSFSTCFYNGGACLSEVLEDEFKRNRFVFKGEACQEQ